MAIRLNDEAAALLRDAQTTKFLSTLGPDGTIHGVFKEFVEVEEDGNILLLELLESSITNRNLVNSLWFKKQVSIAARSAGGTSWQIKGIPIRCLITGPKFEKYYALARTLFGDVDLSSVWIIEPVEARNETFTVRKEEEEAKHPLFVHLDRLAK